MKRRNQKAIALIEMIAVIAVLTIVMMLMNEPIQQVFSALPTKAKDLETYKVLQVTLDTLKQDIQTSQSINAIQTDPHIGPDTLCLNSETDLITYTLENNRITRISTDKQSSQTTELPYTMIQWHPIKFNGQNIAIAITTWNQRKKLGRIHKRLRNSNVYFLPKAK